MQRAGRVGLKADVDHNQTGPVQGADAKQTVGAGTGGRGAHPRAVLGKRRSSAAKVGFPGERACTEGTGKAQLAGEHWPPGLGGYLCIGWPFGHGVGKNRGMKGVPTCRGAAQRGCGDGVLRRESTGLAKT